MYYVLHLYTVYEGVYTHATKCTSTSDYLRTPSYTCLDRVDTLTTYTLPGTSVQALRVVHTSTKHQDIRGCARRSPIIVIRFSVLQLQQTARFFFGCI